MAWDGHERRAGFVALDDRLLDAIRGAVRAELHEAAKDGRILSDDDRRAVTDWIKCRRRWEAMLERAAQTALGSVVVGVLGLIGLAVWEWIKRQSQS